MLRTLLTVLSTIPYAGSVTARCIDAI